MYKISDMIKLKKIYGLSYEDISKESGISLSSVQKIFGGVIKAPRRGTLLALSRVFESYEKEDGIGLYDHDPYDDGPFVAESITPYTAGDSKPYYSSGSSAIDVSDGRSGGDIYSQTGYTYEDYNKLELPAGKRVEVIDGVLYDMSSPRYNHQRIIMRLYVLIDSFIRENKGKCEAIVAPADVRLEYDKGDMTVVQPDLFVVCDRKKLEDDRAMKGVPDFIIEVVSPASRKIDMEIKLEKYKENGVREYWIVDYEKGKVIKNYFEGDIVSIHSFDDKVGVSIYDEKLVIDFAEIKDYLES